MIHSYDDKQIKGTYSKKEYTKLRNQIKDRLNKSDYSNKHNQEILEQIKKLSEAMVQT